MRLEPGLAESHPAKRSRKGAVWGKKNHLPSCAEKLWAVSMKKGKGTHKKEEIGLREGEVGGEGAGGGGGGAGRAVAEGEGQRPHSESNISPRAVYVLLLRKTWSFGKRGQFTVTAATWLRPCPGRALPAACPLRGPLSQMAAALGALGQGAWQEFQCLGPKATNPNPYP